MSVGGAEDALRQVHAVRPGGLRLSDYPLLARRLAESPAELAPLRLVLLSTFTTGLLDPFLVVEGARYGFDIDCFHGGWGQLEQALLSADWRAPEGGEEALVLLARLEDLDADLPARFYGEERGAFAALGQDVIERLETCVALFRQHSHGPVLVANFAVPQPPPLTLFDANDPESLTHGVHALNRELAHKVAARSGVTVWDYAGLVARNGSLDWTDPRLWALARMPVAASNQPALAAHLMRTVRGVWRPPAKCLVVDLDDTLWGGAVGDDGIKGIQLGDDFPGSAFKAFQRAVLGLRDRGILLAVCSANDHDVAFGALESHPEMLLRPEHFAAMRINWRPKSENLQEIADELNIGVDSLILFDDNPVVRAEVRHRLPGVLVIEVPDDPVLFPQALADVPELDAPAVTTEDRARSRSIEAEGRRRVAAREAQSLDDFLASLGMRVRIGSLDASSLQRISQLVLKTNQFNLTTRRHTQAELEAMAAREGVRVDWLRLEDRYGDMGLVCVGILRAEGADAVIDSLILSCRAANRGLEQTMVAHLANVAREMGCGALVGEYAPTPRNHVVAELYPDLGFAQCPGGTDRTSYSSYRLDLATQHVEVPSFVTVLSAVSG